MSIIKIAGACIVLLICAIWAAVMWVGTWGDDDR